MFEWDAKKDVTNQKKHGVSFDYAKRAFFDRKCVIAQDLDHSMQEQRYYCFGKINGEVVTVRFTYRDKTIRIFGAGYWRKGKIVYEEKNKIYR